MFEEISFPEHEYESFPLKSRRVNVKEPVAFQAREYR